MFDNVVNTGGDEWRCTTTGTGAAMIQITDRLDGAPCPSSQRLF